MCTNAHKSTSASISTHTCRMSPTLPKLQLGLSMSKFAFFTITTVILVWANTQLVDFRPFPDSIKFTMILYDKLL